MDQIFELYEFSKLQTETKPFIIDADVLLADPEGKIKAYLDAIGCRFDASILRWTDGSISCNQDEEVRHGNLYKNLEFISKPDDENHSCPDLFPEEVRPCI